MSFFNFLDTNSDITDISWKDRDVFKPMEKVTEHLMRGDSSIPIATRELIAAYVSALNACTFCYGSHAAVAAEYGVSVSLIEELIEDLGNAKVDDKTKAALMFAKKLTLTSSQITDYDLNQLSTCGWEQEDVQQIIYIVSLFNFYNRVLDGHGIKGSTSIYEFAGSHLANHGYKAPPFLKIFGPLIKKKLSQSN